MALTPGDRLGPYRIVAPIGKGGMGDVYRATDTRMGRDVAIKLVSEHFSERFDREVRAIAALNHPNICTVHDVGPNYLVLEYVPGVPLKGPLPEARVLELALQMAAALDAAHARGIIHRDLKPANILVMAGDRLKLLDFGVASWTQQPSRESQETTMTLLSPGSGPGAADRPSSAPRSSDDVETVALPSTARTVAGAVVGTPAYMSPEQASGQAVDVRSDIFSLGVVLYQWLAGRRPFHGETTEALLAAVRQSEPAELKASPEVSRLVAKCLRKDPAERFQNMAQVRQALEKAAASLNNTTPSVAVLPFALVGAGKESEYFSEGLTEDVINALSGISGLKVIARTSTFAFKDKGQDIRSIAEALGVNHVLEGSVRTSGNRIRVTAQLIAAQDGTHLWSKRYDRDLIDVFAIQDEISSAIAAELKLSLSRNEPVKPPTAHFAAYEAVLQGRYHFLRFDPADQAKALSCFERAVAIDPDYAAAHMGIALYHWGQMVIGMADPREAMERSVKAAREGLRLDPLNSEGHHILASYSALHDFAWAKAEKEFDRAIELNPNSPWAYHCKALYLLFPLGRLEEALETEDRVVALDPLSLPVLSTRAVVLECLGRPEAEEETMERVVQLDPNFVLGQWFLVRIRARQGRVDEAIAIAERVVAGAGRWGMTLGALGTAYAAAGKVEAARGVLAELGLEHNRESRAIHSALITAAMGDYDAAFRWIGESLERRDPLMLMFLWGSSFEGMRRDPRFADLLRILKVPPQQISQRLQSAGAAMQAG